MFGTSALGAELEDGSAIHLLTKPVARWRIVLAKLLAAAPVTAGLVAASTLITGLLLGGSDGGLEVTLAVTVAVAIGSVVYATVFLALSVVTSRALIIGLLYVAIWEGALAGLFSGTRILSVRQMVRGSRPRSTRRASSRTAPRSPLPWPSALQSRARSWRWWSPCIASNATDDGRRLSSAACARWLCL